MKDNSKRIDELRPDFDRLTSGELEPRRFAIGFVDGFLMKGFTGHPAFDDRLYRILSLSEDFAGGFNPDLSTEDYVAQVSNLYRNLLEISSIDYTSAWTNLVVWPRRYCTLDGARKEVKHVDEMNRELTLNEGNGTIVPFDKAERVWEVIPILKVDGDGFQVISESDYYLFVRGLDDGMLRCYDKRFFSVSSHKETDLL